MPPKLWLPFLSPLPSPEKLVPPPFRPVDIEFATAMQSQAPPAKEVPPCQSQKNLLC